MFAQVIESAETLRSLKPVAFTIGVGTKAPLQQSDILRGLAAFQKEFPRLGESDFEQKEERFLLRNGETDVEKQAQFQVSQGKAFDYSWGRGLSFGDSAEVKRVFDAIQDGFSLLPLNVDVMDVQCHFVSQWNGQHYEAIWSAYFSGTPLFSLFSPQKILQDDLKFRALVDDDKVVVVRVTSNLLDTEVRRGTFKDDLLKATVGIAHTKPLPPDCRLSAVFAEHIQGCLRYVTERFIPCVIAPLDQALLSLAKRDANR